MGGSPSVISHSSAQKSNTEFTSSLKANFATHQRATLQRQAAQEPTQNGNGLTNGAHGVSNSRPSYKEWTQQSDSQVFIPTLDFTRSGLAEERSQYEITVKLFFLTNEPASCRCAQTREAVDLVLKELQMPSIDLLIVSFPGISFDAEDEEDDDISEEEGPSVNGTEPGQDTTSGMDAKVEDIDTMIKTWGCLEKLHDKGVIGRLGLSEFGSQRLRKFLRKARVKPSVNQINVRDCCVVPKPLILFAKKEGVELLTHNDCMNILPRGTLRELLGFGTGGAGVLADAQDTQDGLRGDVRPQWVTKYTAVVQNRGVIENKGYFALAELDE